MKYSYYNENIAPTSTKLRTWKAKDFTVLWVSLSATVVTYMCGSTLLARGMLWWEALITVFCGTLITLIPILLNSHVGAKYGISFPVYCRASFGLRGANIPVVLRALVACGWFGIVCWIGAQAFYKTIIIFFPSIDKASIIPFLGINFAQCICFAIFWSLHGIALSKGMSSVKMLLNIKAPLLILAGCILLFWSVPYINTKSLELVGVDGAPLHAIRETSFWKLFPSSLTSIIASWAALSLNISDFSRFSFSQKSHVIGQTIGLPLTMTFFSFVGIAVGTATLALYGTVIWDPVDLLSKFSNVFVLMFGLITIIIASLTTNVAANLVSSANDFSNLWPSKISFKTGGYITMVLAIFIQPWKILADPKGYVFSWLLAYCCLFGAIGGILIADYYLIRKKEIDAEQLYIKGGKYWYKHGFNIKSIIAFVCGVVPCVPGFLNSVDLIKTTNFFIDLYDYSWFIGFIISFVIYSILSIWEKENSDSKEINDSYVIYDIAPIEEKVNNDL